MEYGGEIDSICKHRLSNNVFSRGGADLGSQWSRAGISLSAWKLRPQQSLWQGLHPHVGQKEPDIGQ